MNTTKIFRHQDYELICSAKALDSGKFVPGLVISKQVWPSRPRTIAVPGDPCSSEAHAIDCAFNQGVEWVLNYG